jgi:multicomponent Na+:H+ antiporter subunit D
MIRMFTLVFVQDTAFTHGLILGISGLTMVTGVLGAAAQMEMRRVLSFHIVSQIGYMIMGLGLFTPLALAGSVFYIIHHIIVKTNLFLVAGVIAHRTGTLELKKLGGFIHRMPWLAVLFLIPALSLAGLPPLSGFFAKLTLIIAAFRESSLAIAATALAVGLLTLFSMMKIWNEVFWKPMPETCDEAINRRPWTTRDRVCFLGPVVVLAVITVLIGLGAGAVFDLAERTAAQLLDSSDYIRAVLPEAKWP